MTTIVRTIEIAIVQFIAEVNWLLTRLLVQVDEAAEELIPLMGGGRYGIRDVDDMDSRERKKVSARKTAAYMVSRQPKPQSQVRDPLHYSEYTLFDVINPFLMNSLGPGGK